MLILFDKVTVLVAQEVDMKLPQARLGALLFVASLAGISCTGGSDGVVAPDNATGAAAAEAPGVFQANGATRNAIQADCELFGTVGTPAHFKPSSGPFDELYNVAMAGGSVKGGADAISESKPGDQDFNGGRWHVNVLKEGVDPNKYANACRVEQLDMNDFESTNVYFECPLLPQRGRGLNN